MKWVRYRTTWAWGHQDWKLVRHPGDSIDDIESWLLTACVSRGDQKSYSFRGVEWDVYTEHTLPIDVLESLIRTQQAEVASMARRLGILTEELQWMQHLCAERKGDL